MRRMGISQDDALLSIVYENSGEENQIPLSDLVAAFTSFLDHFAEKSLVDETFFAIVQKAQTRAKLCCAFRKKQLARRLGLLTEEGILCGVGESVEDVAETIEEMRCLEASQMRAMSFVPQNGTPMQSLKAPDSLREMLIIAILRLVFPDRLIPATLDVAGLAGLQSRLAAGAKLTRPDGRSESLIKTIRYRHLVCVIRLSKLM